MIDKLVQNPLLIVLYGLAVFYIVEVVVDISHNVWIFNNRHLLDRKPFNCSLCMTGWISILVYVLNIDLIYLFPFALAGIALIIVKIKSKLETFSI